MVMMVVTRRAVLHEGLRWTARLGLASEIGWFGLAARERARPQETREHSSPIMPRAYDTIIKPVEDTAGRMLAGTLYAFLEPLVEHPQGRQTLTEVKEYALLSGIPPELAVAVLAQETGGRLTQRSPAGAVPPMHILPMTARTLEQRLIRGAAEYDAYATAYHARGIPLDDAVHSMTSPALLSVYEPHMPLFDPAILSSAEQNAAREDRGWRINPPLVMLNKRFASYAQPWTGAITSSKENIKASMLYLTRLLVDARDISLRMQQRQADYRLPESILTAAYNAGPGILSRYAEARREAGRIADEEAFAWAWLKKAWPGQPVAYARHVTAFTQLFRRDPAWQAWLENVSPSYAFVRERVRRGIKG